MSKRGTRKATMRAWAINAYGGPERMQIMELPMPEPGPDDVLIRMAGAEVGDWDILVRDGSWPWGGTFPLVVGLAGAGTVAAVGQGRPGLARMKPSTSTTTRCTTTAPGRSTCSCPSRTPPGRRPRST